MLAGRRPRGRAGGRPDPGENPLALGSAKFSAGSVIVAGHASVSVVMCFHESFDPLLSRATALAHRLVGDRDAAAEVAAEAMARLFEHWDTIGQDPDRCTAWTLRVTRNLAIDVLRRSSRERDLTDITTETAAAQSEVVLRLAVRDAVRQLPEQQRRAIALRYLLDRSQADVASELGVRPGTVATHVTRGLARLRAVLGDETQPRGRELPMRVTSSEEVTALIGTDRAVQARITGRESGDTFTADIGVPAVYRGRGGGYRRWGTAAPGTLIGAELDCVVVDVDERQRPVLTDVLTDSGVDEFTGIQQRVRALSPGDRFDGRVSLVLPFGTFVEFDGLRGLVQRSDLDPAAPLVAGQEVAVEVVSTYPPLARIGLRLCP